jgi:FkbM family methyltransferase
MNNKVIKMDVNKNDPMQFSLALIYHNVSPQLCMLENEINNLLSPNQPYFDIGANQGMRSYLMLACGRKTFMFEPNPDLNKINMNRCHLNNFKNFKLEQLCISDKEDIQEFYFSNEHSMSSLEKDFAEVRGVSKKEKVQTTTLDKYIEKNDIKELYPLIKIDVEGHEMNVIKGAEKTIATLKPTFIIEIFSKEHILELYEKLSGLGYSVFGINFGSINIITEIPNSNFLDQYKTSDYLFTYQPNIVDYLKSK